MRYPSVAGEVVCSLRQPRQARCIRCCGNFAGAYSLNISERYAAQCIEVVVLFFQRVFEAVVTFFRGRIREGSETAIEIVVVLVGIEGHFKLYGFSGFDIGERRSVEPSRILGYGLVSDGNTHRLLLNLNTGSRPTIVNSILHQ